MADSTDTAPRPTGTVALVFTDVERSTELWQIDEEAFGWALVEHDQLVRDVLAQFGGTEVKHTGDGFFLVFDDIGRAASFCIELQSRLGKHPWPSELGPVKTRVGLHYGRARMHGNDYRGPAVNLASRICSATSGGQILCSGEAAASLWGVIGLGDRVKSVGSYNLPGLSAPVDIYELRQETALEFDIRPLSAEQPPPVTLSPPETSEAFDDTDEDRWRRIKEALRQADNATAIQELVVLNQRHPMDVKVLTALGVAYGVEQQYELAERCLNSAVEIDPAHASAWFNLARVQGKMGRRDLIGHSITMALRADPHHPKARAVAAKYGIELPDA